MKNSLLSAFVTAPLLAVLPSNAAFTGVEHDFIGSDWGNRYVFYATFDNPNDRLVAVKGIKAFPLDISTCDENVFYQNPFGTDLAPNPVFFAAFPSLASDTFVTIGKMTSSNDFTELSVNWPGFDPSSVSGTNIGWSVDPALPQAWPADGRVLLGQFTTDAGRIDLDFVLEIISDGELIEVEVSTLNYPILCQPSGDEVSYEFTGVVTAVDEEIGFIINPGETVSGTYVFNDGAEDDNPDPDIGQYFNYALEKGVSIHTSLGNLDVDRTGGPQGFVDVVNDAIDEYNVRIIGFVFGPLEVTEIELTFENAAGEAFDSDSLLGGDPMTLDDFTTAVGRIYFDCDLPCELSGNVHIDITSFCLAGTTCDCPGDLDGDGKFVGISDLLVLLANWGPCACVDCVGDLDDDCTVGVNDLLELLSLWGACS